MNDLVFSPHLARAVRGLGAPPPASTTSGLNSGFSWQSQGNTTAPSVGSIVSAIAQDTSGNLYPVTGKVTASGGKNVTFTPIQPAPVTISGSTKTPPLNPALVSATAPIRVSLAYVLGCYQVGLASGFCWVATGNVPAPAVGDLVMAWILSAGKQQTFQGVVTAVDGANVTFTRASSSSRPALATPTATSVTVPYGYVLDLGPASATPIPPVAPIAIAPAPPAPVAVPVAAPVAAPVMAPAPVPIAVPAPIVAAPLAPAPAPIAITVAPAAPVAAPGIPTVAYVMLGILGIGVAGGIAYLVLEGVS